MPPTEELKQALLRQKMGDAEKDFIGVIAKTFKVEYGLVARVICALDYLRSMGLDRGDEDLLHWEASFEEEDSLVEAIHKAIHDGAQRVIVARAIATGRSVSLSPAAIVPEERASELCRGCPKAVDCAAEHLSTPQKCWDGALSNLTVFPLQLFDTHVEVEAQQPHGKHVIPLHKITIKR